MRILTTLFTTAVAAFAGLSSSVAPAVGAGGSTSCTPHGTVWIWPLDGENTQAAGRTADHPPPAPPIPAPRRFQPPTPPVTPRRFQPPRLPTPPITPRRFQPPRNSTPPITPRPWFQPAADPQPFSPRPFDPPLHPTPPTPPTPPTILRPFAPPQHRWDAGHRGVDLAGYGREPVLAANAGTVLYAGFLVDRPVVVVGHGELRTTYEPVLADPSIRVGVQVKRGQLLGILLPGHCAGVPCLHWGLVSGHGHGAVYYDPLLLLGCGAVRLEPDDTSTTKSTTNPAAPAIRSGAPREPARMVRQ